MRSWHVEKVTLVLVCAVLAGALAAYGQGVQTGAITGTLKDPNGATVPNAKVEIYNLQTGTLARSLTSDSDGGYSATLLPPGKYRVEVTIGGFKKHSATEVPVRLNETTRHDVGLEMGTVTETVVVEATATMINTTSATTGQPIDSRTLSALPLPVSNFLFLLTLSTGTAGEPPDVRAANRGIVDINVNGQRTTNNSVSLEGINVNDFNLAHFDTIPLPNPNTISEFKVATSLYDASAGSKGGGALGLVLKSGTKDIHGEAYWNHRNDVLNANEWFRNRGNQSRARLLQNVFGASGSGPFWGVGGFWFLNYQGVRARNGLDPNGAALSPTIQNFPTQADGTTTAALLAAAFTAPGFPIAEADIDPVAVNILNVRSSAYGGTFLVPRSGDAGCPTVSGTATFICQFSAVAPLTDNQYTISYDRAFRRDKDRLSARWFFDNGEVAKPYGTAGATNALPLAFPRGDVQRNRFISTSYLYQITPRQLNEFRFGYSRFNSSLSPTDSISLADIGATRPNEAQFPGMYFISLTGLFSTGVGVNDDRGTISNSYYWADTWSMTAGKHTFRAGGEVAYFQLNRFNRFATRGALTFGGFGGDATPFRTFLTGRPTGLQSAGGDPQRYFRNTDVFLFFQDDWKIHPRWTVNLGLRWEGLGFSREKLNRLGNYNPALLLSQPPRNPFLFPEETNLGGFTGTPGIDGCVLDNCRDINNFAPRVSFAWDVSGNQRTVVRAGYGIYYQRLSNQNILQANLSPPFNVQNIESRPTAGTSPPFQLQNPFPTLPPAVLVDTASIPQIVRFAGIGREAPRVVQGVTICPAMSPPFDVNDPCNFPLFVNEAGQFCVNFSPLSVPASQRAGNCIINLASFTAPPFDTRAPYTQQWNLTIQRELWKGWVVEAGYVGASNVGGIGIFNPFVQLASTSNPIAVTDISGTTHTVTVNTINNEPLRHAILGLSRRRGARFTGNVGKSIYHSSQLTLSRRFQGGLYFQGSYTWSKLIDNVSGSQSADELNITRTGQGGGNLFDLGNIDPRLNRAISDFDRPHRLVVSYNWEIPAPKSGMWNNQVFQGWGISGIVTFQNGLPFSITDPNGGSAFGSGGLSSPSLICAPTAQQITTLPTCTPGTPTTVQQALLGGSLQDRLGHLINPNMFSANLPVAAATGSGTNYGNVPRNAFRAPFQQNWDFSLTKAFRVTEKLRLQFRTDFFNMWNHPIFQTPSSASIGTRGTFGQISTTAIPARLIQFGLRVNY